MILFHYYFYAITLIEIAFFVWCFAPLLIYWFHWYLMAFIVSLILILLIYHYIIDYFDISLLYYFLLLLRFYAADYADIDYFSDIFAWFSSPFSPPHAMLLLPLIIDIIWFSSMLMAMLLPYLITLYFRHADISAASFSMLLDAAICRCWGFHDILRLFSPLLIIELPDDYMKWHAMPAPLRYITMLLFAIRYAMLMLLPFIIFSWCWYCLFSPLLMMMRFHADALYWLCHFLHFFDYFIDYAIITLIFVDAIAFMPRFRFRVFAASSRWYASASLLLSLESLIFHFTPYADYLLTHAFAATPLLTLLPLLIATLMITIIDFWCRFIDAPAERRFTFLALFRLFFWLIDFLFWLLSHARDAAKSACHITLAPPFSGFSILSSLARHVDILSLIFFFAFSLITPLLLFADIFADAAMPLLLCRDDDAYWLPGCIRLLPLSLPAFSWWRIDYARPFWCHISAIRWYAAIISPLMTISAAIFAAWLALMRARHDMRAMLSLHLSTFHAWLSIFSPLIFRRCRWYFSPLFR